jgi:hypothetical protein
MTKNSGNKPKETKASKTNNSKKENQLIDKVIVNIVDPNSIKIIATKEFFEGIESVSVKYGNKKL